MPKLLKYPAFRPASEPVVNVVQRETRQSIKDLAQTPTVQGKMVTVKLSTSTLRVSHGLGRKWQGWQVVDIDAAANVYRDTSDGKADPTVYVALKASAGTPTVTLWIF